MFDSFRVVFNVIHHVREKLDKCTGARMTLGSGENIRYIEVSEIRTSVSVIKK